MKKIKIKTPAKINLTLDILGVTENFHDIKSLVASIDLFDEITIIFFIFRKKNNIPHIFYRSGGKEVHILSFIGRE